MDAISMSVNDLYDKSKKTIDRGVISKWLDRLYTSNIPSDIYSKFEDLSVILKYKQTKVTPVNTKDVTGFMYELLPDTIAKLDIKHAMEIAGYNDEEQFKIMVANESTRNPSEHKKYISNLIQKYIYYVDDSKLSYANISSTDIFPNVERFRDADEHTHEFIINATGENYMAIVSRLFESFVRDSIPFDFQIRLPKDIPYGFPDSIVLKCSRNKLQATIDEIEMVTRELRDKLEIPCFDICAPIDGRYGYVQLDPKTTKTSIELICSAIPKIMDEWLYIYTNGELHGELDWNTRINRLIKTKGVDPESYELLIDEIIKFVNTMDINMNDLFKFDVQKELTHEQVMETLGIMNEIIDKLKVTGNEEDNQYDPYNATQLSDEITGEKDQLVYDDTEEVKEVVVEPEIVPIEVEQEIKNDIQEEPTTETVISNTMPQIDEPTEVFDVNQITSAIDASSSDEKEEIKEDNSTSEDSYILDDYYPSSIESSNESEESQINTDSIEDNISNEKVTETPEEIEIHDVLNNMNNYTIEDTTDDRVSDETQAYVFTKEELESIEAKKEKTSTPVLPEDAQEVSINEEDKLYNTGAYGIQSPIEVTSFDSDIINSDEVESIVNVPEVDLGDYKGIITPEKAITPVVDENGNTIEYIEFLNNHKELQEGQYILNEGATKEGKDYIGYVSPSITPGCDATKVINNYCLEHRIDKKKPGFFAKIFGKK